MNCIYCKRNTLNPYWYYGGAKLDSCSFCGTINLANRPGDDELTKLYEKEYYNKRFTNTQSLDPSVENFLVYNAEKRLQLLQKETENGKLLEIGSGYGQFIWIAQNAGFECEGIELGIEAADYAKNKYNLKISNNPLTENSYEKNSFDIIVMFHVFEHLTNPKEIMENCLKFLKPGGKLIIEIPDIEYVRKFGSHQHKINSLHFPFHVGFYKRSALKNILADTGFSQICIKSVTDQYYNQQPNILKTQLSNILKFFGQSGLIWASAEKPLT